MRERLQTLGLLPLALLSFTATLMMALGAPPHGTTWLIWLGFVPLTLVARVSRHRRPRRVFLLGWIGAILLGLLGQAVAVWVVFYAPYGLTAADLGSSIVASWIVAKSPEPSGSTTKAAHESASQVVPAPRNVPPSEVQANSTKRSQLPSGRQHAPTLVHGDGSQGTSSP